MATKVIMPQLGESVVEGTVTRWLKKVGDRVDEFEPLLEVNTDKVDTEIPSPAGGTVLKILVEEQTTVKAGVVLCWIGTPGEAIPGEPSPLPHEQPQHAIQAEPAQSAPPGGQAGAGVDLGFISPVVARIAGQHNIDLAQVKGTGMGGRITKKDVLAYLEKRKEPTAAPWESQPESGGDLFRPTDEIYKRSQPAVPPVPAPLPAVPGKALEPVPGEPQSEILPLSPMRKKIAEHMVRSKTIAPHVTTVMEADLSRIVADRDAKKAAFERSGTKLTFTPYFILAIVEGLKAFPIVNSSWTEEGVKIHKEINVGMATALEDGLIVPVVKGADGLSLAGVTRVVNDLANRARQGSLRPDEVTGGTFTLTNHGIFGSLFATPIINQPQCGILGVGAIQKRVVVIQDAIAIRPMVYLSLTFDHRILDGAIADRFLAKIVQVLQNWA